MKIKLSDRIIFFKKKKQNLEKKIREMQEITKKSPNITRNAHQMELKHMKLGTFSYIITRF